MTEPSDETNQGTSGPEIKSKKKGTWEAPKMSEYMTAVTEHMSPVDAFTRACTEYRFLLGQETALEHLEGVAGRYLTLPAPADQDPELAAAMLAANVYVERVPGRTYTSNARQWYDKKLEELKRPIKAEELLGYLRSYQKPEDLAAARDDVTAAARAVLKDGKHSDAEDNLVCMITGRDRDAPLAKFVRGTIKRSNEHVGSTATADDVKIEWRRLVDKVRVRDGLGKVIEDVRHRLDEGADAYTAVQSLTGLFENLASVRGEDVLDLTIGLLSNLVYEAARCGVLSIDQHKRAYEALSRNRHDARALGIADVVRVLTGDGQEGRRAHFHSPVLYSDLFDAGVTCGAELSAGFGSDEAFRRVKLNVPKRVPSAAELERRAEEKILAPDREIRVSEREQRENDLRLYYNTQLSEYVRRFTENAVAEQRRRASLTPEEREAERRKLIEEHEAREAERLRLRAQMDLGRSRQLRYKAAAENEKLTPEERAELEAWYHSDGGGPAPAPAEPSAEEMYVDTGEHTVEELRAEIDEVFDAAFLCGVHRIAARLGQVVRTLPFGVKTVNVFGTYTRPRRGKPHIDPWWIKWQVGSAGGGAAVCSGESGVGEVRFQINSAVYRAAMKGDGLTYDGLQYGLFDYHGQEYDYIDPQVCVRVCNIMKNRTRSGLRTYADDRRHELGKLLEDVAVNVSGVVAALGPVLDRARENAARAGVTFASDVDSSLKGGRGFLVEALRTSLDMGDEQQTAFVAGMLNPVGGFGETARDLSVRAILMLLSGTDLALDRTGPFAVSGGGPHAELARVYEEQVVKTLTEEGAADAEDRVKGTLEAFSRAKAAAKVNAEARRQRGVSGKGGYYDRNGGDGAPVDLDKKVAPEQKTEERELFKDTGQLVLNVFESDADAVVCPVNTMGVMSARPGAGGLAGEMRRRLMTPEGDRTVKDAYYLAYKDDCDSGRLRIGRLTAWRDPATGTWIINFPTKTDYRRRSTLDYVKQGLADLPRVMREIGAGSVVIPPLGCGLGGLDWEDVGPLVRDFTEDHSRDFRVDVAGMALPAKVEQPKREEPPAGANPTLKRAGGPPARRRGEGVVTLNARVGNVLALAQSLMGQDEVTVHWTAEAFRYDAPRAYRALTGLYRSVGEETADRWDYCVGEAQRRISAAAKRGLTCLSLYDERLPSAWGSLLGHVFVGGDLSVLGRPMVGVDARDGLDLDEARLAARAAGVVGSNLSGPLDRKTIVTTTGDTVNSWGFGPLVAAAAAYGARGVHPPETKEDSPINLLVLHPGNAYDYVKPGSSIFQGDGSVARTEMKNAVDGDMGFMIANNGEWYPWQAAESAGRVALRDAGANGMGAVVFMDYDDTDYTKGGVKRLTRPGVSQATATYLVGRVSDYPVLRFGGRNRELSEPDRERFMTVGGDSKPKILELDKKKGDEYYWWDIKNDAGGFGGGSEYIEIPLVEGDIETSQVDAAAMFGQVNDTDDLVHFSPDVPETFGFVTTAEEECTKTGATLMKYSKTLDEDAVKRGGDITRLEWSPDGKGDLDKRRVSRTDYEDTDHVLGGSDPCV